MSSTCALWNIPFSAFDKNAPAYVVRVSADEGLYTLADRLGVQLYDRQQIASLKPLCLQPIARRLK